jgi:hypothetical protein
VNENKANIMAEVNNCGVCGRALVYAPEAVKRKCAYCGREDMTMIYCPEGHYICDSCHSKSALEVLREVLSTSRSANPAEILEMVMAHPAVPMHGPEHHAIVPGAIVAAVRNSGYPLPDGAVEKALERASKVPGGWCGFYGDCGAAVGVGIAVSVITGATPLTGKQRTLALAATSQALGRMLDDQPRCCKRASRIAVESAVDFLHEKLGMNLPGGDKVKCSYSRRNQQCPKDLCAYYAEGA